MPSPYFRLNYSSRAALDQLIASEGLAGLAPELGMMLRPGHIVLAAHYDTDRAVGHVRAMGRVTSNGSRLSINWRLIQFELHPTGSGQRFWTREHFNFAPAVAQRYGLAERAAGLFDEPMAPTPDTAASRPAAPDDDPGYIYVIRSQYGFKIGKTRNLHGRTRLFGVKLPFPIEVELTGWCARYSETERALHREFAAKRLEGEWFALDGSDLAALRARFA